MSAEVKDVLVRAKALISSPQNWTQGSLARDDVGRIVSTRHKDASRWCALGAICAFTHPRGGVRYKAIGLLRSVAKGAICATNINDYEGHEAVMALYDRAIEAAAEAESKA